MALSVARATRSALQPRLTITRVRLPTSFANYFLISFGFGAVVNSIFVYLFIFQTHLFISESVHERGEGQRERERVPKQTPAESAAQCGARSREPKIMTSAETKSQLLN